MQSFIKASLQVGADVIVINNVKVAAKIKMKSGA
jgi:hypothetical protein